MPGVTHRCCDVRLEARGLRSPLSTHDRQGDAAVVDVHRDERPVGVRGVTGRGRARAEQLRVAGHDDDGDLVAGVERSQSGRDRS